MSQSLSIQALLTFLFSGVHQHGIDGMLIDWIAWVKDHVLFVFA